MKRNKRKLSFTYTPDGKSTCAPGHHRNPGISFIGSNFEPNSVNGGGKENKHLLDTAWVLGSAKQDEKISVPITNSVNYLLVNPSLTESKSKPEQLFLKEILKTKTLCLDRDEENP